METENAYKANVLTGQVQWRKVVFGRVSAGPQREWNRELLKLQTAVRQD